MLHYAGPPGVGGVEATIAYHARGLADLGYHVRVISGSGGQFDQRVETHINPLFGSNHPDILAVKKQLDQGQVTSEFERLRAQLVHALRTAFEGCDACIVHNVHSLNKNLILTAALCELNGQPPCLAWCHDLAWTNTQYQPELHPGYPWDLLRQVWPGTVYVTVSEPRRVELAELLGVSPDTIHVVLPGVDPARFQFWTETTERLARELQWMEADGLLLLPARLTRRKNIALALRVLAELRDQSKRDFRLIVTGPPGPHNPANPGYLAELLSLRTELGIEETAHFLYAYSSGDAPLIPDDDTLANLFALSDALFFPSTQEGFGIPILEAGLAGLPVFCADIPPLRATAMELAVYFDPVQGNPAAIAALVLHTLDQTPTYQLRVRVRQQYRWDAMIRNQIVPLIDTLLNESERTDE
ncbi:MAG: glycosyltransferase family 4 protein [bacterium]|nr:glycosyltransferase family 4 protein [bacterium]